MPAGTDSTAWPFTSSFVARLHAGLVDEAAGLLGRDAHRDFLDVAGPVVGGLAALEGDRFAEALPREGLIVRIRIIADDERTLEVQPLGDRGADLADDWAAACGLLPGVAVEVGDAR